MTEIKAPPCYTDDWKRTHPDFVVYLPPKRDGRDGDNEHLLVFETPKGDLMAFWTQGTDEGDPDQHVVYARSRDGGVTWSQPSEIDGPTESPGLIASWAFPVISKTGRIYCFLNKNIGVVDMNRQITGIMRCYYSDDDGCSWMGGDAVPVRPTKYDHPDPRVPKNWIVWQKPIRDSKGRWIVGCSRWTSFQICPAPRDPWLRSDSHSELLRFENIEENPEPKDIAITWLPDDEDLIGVPAPGDPPRSVAEEPSIVLLPDDRLFMVMRTMTGRIWYTVSEDDGPTWRAPEALRYRDGGEEVLNPLSCDPIYALADGRYLLVYHNHDGTRFFARHAGDSPLNRRPVCIAVGEFRPEAHQPVWFSQGLELYDSHGIGVGPRWRTQLPMYGSLTERNGRRVLWYPDRKHFLLGKIISDELLERCGEVPKT
jgi:hypothetical protein